MDATTVLESMSTIDDCNSFNTIRSAFTSDNDNEYLFVAAKNNHINVVRIILKLKTIDNKTLYSTFLNFCAFGHFDSCKWMVQVFPQIKEYICQETLEIIVKHGHMQIYEYISTLVRDIDDEPLLILAVTRGYINLAKYIYSSCDPICIKNICPDIFWQAVISGNILMTEWLLDIDSSVNIEDKYICLSCELGHLDMCKWLYERNSSMACVDNFTISRIISKGHDHIVVWLIDTFPELETSLIAKSTINDEELLAWVKKHKLEPDA